MEKYGISFKEMNKKQKVKHIWTYYRYHILAVIIVAAVIFSLGKTIFFPAPQNSVDIMVCGTMDLGSDQIEEVDRFKEDYNTGLSLVALNWEKDLETADVMMQKLPLMVRVRSLDVVALPEEEFEKFAKIYGTDMFTPLDTVPKLSDVLNANKDKLYTCNKAIDQYGNEIDADEHVYGIKVEDFPQIKCIEQSEEMVVGLTSTLRNVDKAYCMFKYMVGDESALTHYFEEDDSEEQQTK